MSFKLSSDKFNNIKGMIDQFTKNDKLELESRFFGKNFSEDKLDVTKFTNTLNHFIYDKDDGGLGLKYDVISELVINDEYDKNKRLIIKGQDNIKKYWLNGVINGLEYSFMRKENLEKTDINEYSLRFSLSEEEELDKENETIEYLKNSNRESLKMYRFKNRYQVYVDDLLRIDFTSVKQSNKSYNTFRNSNTLKSKVNYEIEVELLHTKNNKKSEDIFNEYMRVNYLILSLIQNNKKIMNISEKNEVIKNYNLLVNVKNNNSKKHNRNKKGGFIVANPVTLHVENIEKNDNIQNIYNKYAVTVKADGERRLLYVNKNGSLYLIDINFNVYDLGLVMKDWVDSLIECEHIVDKKLVLMYDMLFSKGKDIRRTHLKVKPSERSKNNYGRLGALEYFLNDYKKLKENGVGIKLENKKYLFSAISDGSDIFQKSKELWCDKDNLLYHVDGLIYIPITEHYPLHSGSWYSLFKWKPPELNTIDFLVRTVKDSNQNDTINPFMLEGKTIEGKIEKSLSQYKTLQLFVGGKIKDVDRNNKFKFSYGAKLFDPAAENENDDGEIYNRANVFITSENKMFTKDLLSGNEDEIKDNMIVEFGYDPNKENEFRWIPYRVRYDKTQSYRNGMKVYGNNENIANDIFRSLLVPITEEMIITGQIPDSIRKKAEMIKTKNVNNAHHNNYYKNINNKYDPNNRNSYQNFHNVWVKENLYRKVSPALNSGNGKPNGRLLDLGSGKGGDITKWKRSKYSYVIGIEYDIKNIEYAKNLFAKIPHPKPKVYFVRGDVSKLIFPNYDAGLSEANKINLENFLPTENTFNVVSIQFALHYFFKDQITFLTLLQNVTDNLEVGGYFIGTCFDGKRVFNKLKGRKKIEGKLDGQTLWSIEKVYKQRTLPNTKTSFGREIDVYVKSIGKTHREYLVNFDYFEKVLNEYGFEKVEVKSFSEYYDDLEKNGNNNKKAIAKKMTESEKEFSFLNNAFIFKKIENTPVSKRANLIKLMKKQETKNFKKNNKEEVKETMNNLGVSEVTESTEDLIENEEMDTDLESDLEIEMDKEDNNE